MKRRSFLQSIGAGIAALFVPAAAKAAEKYPFQEYGYSVSLRPDTQDALFKTDHIRHDDASISSGGLSEQALEDMVIEIQKSGQHISIMPTTVFYWRPW